MLQSLQELNHHLLRLSEPMQGHSIKFLVETNFMSFQGAGDCVMQHAPTPSKCVGVVQRMVEIGCIRTEECRCFDPEIFRCFGSCDRSKEECGN